MNSGVEQLRKYNVDNESQVLTVKERCYKRGKKEREHEHCGVAEVLLWIYVFYWMGGERGRSVEIWVYEWDSIRLCISKTCQLWRPSKNENIYHSCRSWFLIKIPFLKKNKRLFGEIKDSKAGTGKLEHDPEISLKDLLRENKYSQRVSSKNLPKSFPQVLE